MALRSDALGAAARFVLAAHEVARSIPGAVATIGRLVALPGATNTIPDRAELFADLRAPDAARLDALVQRSTAAAAEAAAAGACTVEVLLRWRYEPVAMDPATSAARAPGGRPASAWIRSSYRRAPGTTPRSWPGRDPECDAVRAQRRRRRQPRT